MFLTKFHLIKFEADEGGQGGNNLGENGTDEGSQGGGQEGKQDSSEKKFTQKEVDELIAERANRAVAKALKDKEEADQAKVDEAKRMEDMTKQQRSDFEKEKLQKRIDELEAKQMRSEMTSQARAKLSELEVTATEDVINLLVTDKAETTLKNVELFAEGVKKAVEERYQKDRIGGTPGASSASKSGGKLDLGQQLAMQEKQRVEANNKVPGLWG